MSNNSKPCCCGPKPANPNAPSINVPARNTTGSYPLTDGFIGPYPITPTNQPQGTVFGFGGVSFAFGGVGFGPP